MEIFLNSKEFAKYRQFLLDTMSEFVSARLFGTEADLREMCGAIKLMRLIIRTPLKIRQSEEVKQMINKDFEGLKKYFIINELRSSLRLSSEKTNQLGE